MVDSSQLKVLCGAGAPPANAGCSREKKSANTNKQSLVMVAHQKMREPLSITSECLPMWNVSKVSHGILGGAVLVHPFDQGTLIVAVNLLKELGLNAHMKVLQL